MMMTYGRSVHTSVLTETPNLLSSPQIPHLDELVLAARGQPFASWTRRDRLDKRQMGRKDENGCHVRLDILVDLSIIVVLLVRRRIRAFDTVEQFFI